MHLNASEFGNPTRILGKGIDGEIAPNFTIDPMQEVQIERGGHAR